MKPDAHSRNLRRHRLSDTPATFFITKSLLPKKAVLDEVAREIVVSAFAFAVRQQRIYLRAFVVMPDHWHALFALREPWTLPKFMHDMMSYVGGKTNALLTKHKTYRQDGYYDTRVKTAKQFDSSLATSSKILSPRDSLKGRKNGMRAAQAEKTW
jgi:REP element-mobilizing transposase RayT